MSPPGVDRKLLLTKPSLFWSPPLWSRVMFWWWQPSQMEPTRTGAHRCEFRLGVVGLVYMWCFWRWSYLQMEPTPTGAHRCEFRLGLDRCGWVRLGPMLLAVILLSDGAKALLEPTGVSLRCPWPAGAHQWKVVLSPGSHRCDLTFPWAHRFKFMMLLPCRSPPVCCTHRCKLTEPLPTRSPPMKGCVGPWSPPVWVIVSWSPPLYRNVAFGVLEPTGVRWCMLFFAVIA